ncbi:hypothetical protein BV22DRAFT_531841 [Leucogyrophana mollusca]|uniref:Uncharacterized protein n=1 Tax=Leucogyrophana mollusca TaxID=85980 RepID=A0ACB8BFA6_9AGAM|nr:hypothetical protein BV22DRAFT_531841 [Leucogyrophana mollusca]
MGSVRVYVVCGLYEFSSYVNITLVGGLVSTACGQSVTLGGDVSGCPVGATAHRGVGARYGGEETGSVSFTGTLAKYFVEKISPDGYGEG